MKLKFAAIGASALVLTTCSIPAAGIQMIERPIGPSMRIVSEESLNIFEITIKQKEQEELIREQKLEALRREYNEYLISQRIEKLESYIGKTWYVFSGSTPEGWDCSGLTMWFYEKLGVSLEHSATKQYQAGKLVSNPKAGDIVVFKYNGSERAYHVGIYISENIMLHSGGKKGDRTEYQRIDAFAGNYSEVHYVRFIDN